MNIIRCWFQKIMQKKKKKKNSKMHTERVGNLPNLGSCSQDGSVGGHHHSVLVSLVAWNQAAQSYLSLPQSLQNLWSGVQTEALSLHGGTVSPREGAGAKVDGGFHLEKLPETSPRLNSPGAKVYQITWPRLSADQVLTGPPISLLSLFLLLTGPTVTLKTLNQCALCDLKFWNCLQ